MGEHNTEKAHGGAHGGSQTSSHRPPPGARGGHARELGKGCFSLQLPFFPTAASQQIHALITDTILIADTALWTTGPRPRAAFPVWHLSFYTNRLKLFFNTISCVLYHVSYKSNLVLWNATSEEVLQFSHTVTHVPAQTISDFRERARGRAVRSGTTSKAVK